MIWSTEPQDKEYAINNIERLLLRISHLSGIVPSSKPSQYLLLS